MERDKILKSFGERVKDRRIAARLSQEYVADIMGYKTRSSIQKIEVGKADIPQSKIYQLATVLKTTPAYLMGLTNNPSDFETRQDEFIDRPLPLDAHGNLDKRTLEREYMDLMLADPKVFKLLQDLMSMTIAHRDIVYSLADRLAEEDKRLLEDDTRDYLE